MKREIFLTGKGEKRILACRASSSPGSDSDGSTATAGGTVEGTKVRHHVTALIRSVKWPSSVNAWCAVFVAPLNIRPGTKIKETVAVVLYNFELAASPFLAHPGQHAPEPQNPKN
jgi:hypothetical protein